MNYTQKVLFIVCAGLGVLVVLALHDHGTFKGSETRVTAETTTNVSSSQNPPERRHLTLVPAIEKEGGGREVQIEDQSQQGCPVQLVRGTTFIGERAYGKGLMEFRNISRKTLYFISGEFIFESTHGPVTTSWKLGGTGSLLTGGWKPGRLTAVPTGGRVTPVLDEPGAKLRAVSIQVTGAVFADGTVWGEEGESLRESLKAENVSWHALVLNVIDACSKWPANVVETQLVEGRLKSGIYPNGSAPWYLRKVLLDESNHLRPDAIERLKRMSDMLENPFQER